MSERFVARNSTVRVLLLMAGAVGFMLLGIWVAGLLGPPPRPGREWIGLAALLFFGLCFLLGIRRLFQGGDQIVVDRKGIFWRQWSETTIPWGAIVSFETRSIRHQHFVSLWLKDPSLFPSSGFGALFGGMNKGLGFGDVSINATGTDRSFAQLLDAVERFAPSHVLRGPATSLLGAP
jgi:hypothetical protein